MLQFALQTALLCASGVLSAPQIGVEQEHITWIGVQRALRNVNLVETATVIILSEHLLYLQNTVQLALMI